METSAENQNTAGPKDEDVAPNTEAALEAATTSSGGEEQPPTKREEETAEALVTADSTIAADSDDKASSESKPIVPPAESPATGGEECLQAKSESKNARASPAVNLDSVKQVSNILLKASNSGGVRRQGRGPASDGSSPRKSGPLAQTAELYREALVSVVKLCEEKASADLAAEAQAILEKAEAAKDELKTTPDVSELERSGARRKQQRKKWARAGARAGEASSPQGGEAQMPTGGVRVPSQSQEGRKNQQPSAQSSPASRRSQRRAQRALASGRGPRPAREGTVYDTPEKLVYDTPVKLYDIPVGGAEPRYTNPPANPQDQAKGEQVRNELRAATREPELTEAIRRAKQQGFEFEATLGEKKLQRLRAAC